MPGKGKGKGKGQGPGSKAPRPLGVAADGAGDAGGVSERDSLFGGGARRGLGASGLAPLEDDESFVRRHVSEHQVMQKQQEEHLDALDDATRKLADVARNIAAEIDTQGAMLDDLHDDQDELQSNFDKVTKKTREFVEKSGGVGSLCIIFVLSMVLLLLIYLVLWT